MDLLNIYINLIRIILVILSIYHIYKRDNKIVISTSIVFILTFALRLLDKFLSIRPGIIGGFSYITIIFMTIYLGSALKFYDKYYWWDMLIHFISGIAFVSFGLAIINKVDNINRFYMLLFCFTFSIALHVIWEVLEYLSDCMFHSDNQRWQRVSPSINHASEGAIQPAGLLDTMNDTIICIAGNAVLCLVWCFIL